MPFSKKTRFEYFVWEGFLYLYRDLALNQSIGPTIKGNGPVEKMLLDVWEKGGKNRSVAFRKLKALPRSEFLSTQKCFLENGLTIKRELLLSFPQMEECVP